MEDYGTIWVCQDCMLHHANGECGGCHSDYGHDKEPLSSIDGDFTVAMGMAFGDHGEDCSFNAMGDAAPDGYECYCEIDTYSTSQCEGCGSYLHGKRHAMTLFKD